MKATIPTSAAWSKKERERGSNDCDARRYLLRQPGGGWRIESVSVRWARTPTQPTESSTSVLRSNNTLLLLDNSAWARLESPSLPESRRLAVAGMIENDGIAVCVPFLLEAGWSARSAAHHEELLADLLQLPFLPIDTDVERGALSAQRDLARRGHQRSASPSDLLIAACAHVNHAGILHYDRDYDLLAELTGLAFESTWLADAGTL